MQELLKNSNITEKNQIYYTSQFEHSLIIPDPRKLSIATTEITKVPRSCEAAHEDSKVEAQKREEYIT